MCVCVCMYKYIYIYSFSSGQLQARIRCPKAQISTCLADGLRAELSWSRVDES